MATIFARRSSEALSSQCRSSNTMISGVSRLRACTSRRRSSRVRKPISTPSSPSKAPSGGLRPSRLSNRPRFSVERRPRPLQTFVQLARHDVFTVAWRQAECPAHDLDEGAERRLLSVRRAVSDQDPRAAP